MPRKTLGKVKKVSKKVSRKPVRTAAKSAKAKRSTRRHKVSPLAIGVAVFVGGVGIIAASLAFAAETPADGSLHLDAQPQLFAEPTLEDKLFFSNLELLRLQAESAALRSALVPNTPAK